MAATTRAGPGKLPYAEPFAQHPGPERDGDRRLEIEDHRHSNRRDEPHGKGPEEIAGEEKKRRAGDSDQAETSRRQMETAVPSR